MGANWLSHSNWNQPLVVNNRQIVGHLPAPPQTLGDTLDTLMEVT